jgi:hypothetical protein
LPAATPTPSRLGLAAGFIGTLAILGFGAYALWQARHDGDAPETPVRASEPRGVEPTATITAMDIQPSAAVVAAPQAQKAELTVESVPPGAAVSLDGVAVGVTPMNLLLDVDPRERTVRIELGGFRGETRAVVVDRNRVVSLPLKRIARDKPVRPALDIKEGR